MPKLNTDHRRGLGALTTFAIYLLTHAGTRPEIDHHEEEFFFLHKLGGGAGRSNECTIRTIFGSVFNHMSATHDVTQLLVRWANGDKQALDDLTPLVYRELRMLAASQLRKERKSHTLQPTALVHEAYLRLVGQKSPDWQNRSHFFGVASQLMRQILVDHARKRHADKRAGQRVSLEDAVSFQKERSHELLALDSCLTILEKVDPRKCRAVELRYFAGLSMEEIAHTLDVSAVTVRRDLRMAEAWLNHEMRDR